MNQYNFLSLSLSCLDLSTICCFQVNLLPRVIPRYLTVSLLGTVILLMETYGQVCFCSVKLTCVDFFSLISKPHLWNHFSIESRPRWRVDETIFGLAWDANSAVSSTNVAMVISVDIGKSAV